MDKYELKEIIKKDLQTYGVNKLFYLFPITKNAIICKTIVLARKKSFYGQNKVSLVNKMLFRFYSLCLVKIGFRNGLELNFKNCGEKLLIYHTGIVISDNATIGNNVTMRGGNCIGNNGKNEDAPTIGNNVDIGFGAIILGPIHIADGCKIGANSVVVKDVLVPNSVIIGKVK